VIGDEDRLDLASVQMLRRQGDDVLVRAPGLDGRMVVAERSPLLGAGIAVRPFREGGAAQPDSAQDRSGGGAGAGAGAQNASDGEMITLDPARREALIGAVKRNPMMPDDAKQRILKQLEAEEVPAAMVERLESRMGG